MNSLNSLRFKFAKVPGLLSSTVALATDALDVSDASISMGFAKRPSTTQSCTNCNRIGSCSARRRIMHDM